MAPDFSGGLVLTVSGAAASGGYEAFFGLKESPFSLTPNPRFLFESATLMAALEQITYALRRREPLIVNTGDIGTGKTMLCRTVLDRLERLTFLSIIADPLLGRDDLLKQILEDFGVISKGRTKLVQPSRHELIRALQEFLISLIPLQAHAVVMIDEAQHLHPDVLEEIRLLSNIEADQGTQLQIVLVGQTDLEAALKRPDMRQFQQRVTRRFRLEPLDAREGRQYIEHRLRIAAETGSAAQESTVFTSDAMDAAARLSGGLPRVMNIICDRALEAAFAQRRHVVDLAAVASAAGALGIATTAEPALPAPPALSDFDRLFEEAAASAPHPSVGPSRASSPAPPAVLSLPNLPDRRSLATPAKVDLPHLPDPPDLPELPVRSAIEDSYQDEIEGLDGATFEPRIETHNIRRYAVAGLAVAAVAVAVWFGSRTASAPPAAPSTAPIATAPPASNVPAPPATAPAPETTPAATPTEPSQPAPTTVTPPAPDPAASAVEPPGSGGRFEIVVASFRTDSRTATVAEQVAALGLPYRTRTVGDGWRQVLAGPFASRAEAEAAQQRLDDAGLGASQIVAR